MLFAYAFCFGPQNRPEICISADKPDANSFPVPIRNFVETKYAIIRISQQEGLRVRIDEEDGGIILEPISPSRLHVTPNQAERAGMTVKLLKVNFAEDGSFVAHYRDESREAQWKIWRPNEFI